MMFRKLQEMSEYLPEARQRAAVQREQVYDGAHEELQ